MLIALDIILKLTVGINVTESMKISFAFIAIASIGMLYGPTVGFAAGFICDLLGFIIKPSGAFDIRFTLIEALGGLLYGLFLYNAVNDKWLLPRIVAAKSTVVIICNLWLTNWAVSSMMGKGFLALFPARAIKNLAQLPLDIFLLAIFLPLILKAYNTVFKGARKIDENTVFSDVGANMAMIYFMCIVMIIICSVGFIAQDLKDKNTDLKNTVKEQTARIDIMQSEIDKLYADLGLEKPATEEAAE